MSNDNDLFCQIERGELLSGVLSSSKGLLEGLVKVCIRPVLIKEQHLYQISDHYPQKVMHRNLTASECVKLIQACLPHQFRQGIFSAQGFNYHVLVNKRNEMTVMKKAVPVAASLPLAHNRTKNYLFEEGVAVPFLVALGVMNAHGKVQAKKYDKFRQINRFVEMVRDVVDYLPKGRQLEVIDFGCGKSYLTFALYHYLKHIAKRDVRILGLDLKEDVIRQCQALATELECHNLSFAVGDINQHVAGGKVDLVISLHACDTATDAALEKAVEWDTEVILCVPCCQHELYNQVESDALATILRHGILRERFAALATDAARADLLTGCGYDVQILEFIDMEHTPKNLLLRAVKAPSSTKQQQARHRYHAFKDALQITPSLEKRLSK